MNLVRSFDSETTREWTNISRLCHWLVETESMVPSIVVGVVCIVMAKLHRNRRLFGTRKAKYNI